jgi:23S rRNA pseudouridine2604 synthase
MSSGVEILGTRTLPCKVKQLSGKKFSIILQQGLNRQIRRMCEELGYEVQTLTRVRIMHIRLDNIAVGKWRHLHEHEVKELEKAVSQSKKEK